MVRNLLITNVPAPYRIPVFNLLGCSGRDFIICFQAHAESRRKWTVPFDEMHFDRRFLTSGRTVPFAVRETAAALAMLGSLTICRPEAIVCGGYDSLAAWVCFLWSKIFRCRFVLWLESTARDQRQPGRMKTLLKKMFVRHADAIAAAGKATVEYVKGLGACDEKIFISPMSTDNEFFAREAAKVEREGVKRKMDYPPRLILYSGRLDRKKGVFTLLEAFVRISRELPDVGLLIAGHGPEQKNMENFCRAANLGHVYFLGAREYHQMPAAYALADVLALPTFSDTWGMVVNEAFACGVPVVVSSVAGACDDLIVDGETGFAVNSGDPVELAGRIVQILRDPALRLRMSANCRALIRQYSPEACARGLMQAAQGARA